MSCAGLFASGAEAQRRGRTNCERAFFSLARPLVSPPLLRERATLYCKEHQPRAAAHALRRPEGEKGEDQTATPPNGETDEAAAERRLYATTLSTLAGFR